LSHALVLSALIYLVNSQAGVFQTPKPVSPLPRGSGELAANRYPNPPKRFYVFGGVIDRSESNSTGWIFLNDIWRCNIANALIEPFQCIWKRFNVHPNAVVPTARSFASTGVVTKMGKDVVLVYGGGLFDDTQGMVAPATDSFYKFTTVNGKWTDLTRQVPAGLGARLGAASTTYKKKYYVFGGINGFFQALDDLWVYDSVTELWQLVAEPPAKRSLPMTISPEILAKALHGSLKRDFPFNVAKSSQSTSIEADDAKRSLVFPSARFTSGLETIKGGDALWMYGGAAFAPGFVFIGDVWEYDLTTDMWTQLYDPSAPGSTVAPRSFFATSSDKKGDTVYLYGGDEQPQFIQNELLSWDVTAQDWTVVPLSGDVPPPLYRTAGVNANDDFYIVGGYDRPNGQDMPVFAETIYRTEF